MLEKPEHTPPMVVQRIPRKVRFFDVSILSCSTARENSRAVLQLRMDTSKKRTLRYPLHHHRRRVLRLFQHLWAIPVLRISGQFHPYNEGIKEK